MTDEELQQEIQSLSESLDKLPDDPSTKQERSQRYNLLLKKETLQKIKQAREKGSERDEAHNLMVYNLLETWGEKHPFMTHLVMANMRWNVL